MSSHLCLQWRAILTTQTPNSQLGLTTEIRTAYVATCHSPQKLKATNKLIVSTHPSRATCNTDRPLLLMSLPVHLLYNIVGPLPPIHSLWKMARIHWSITPVPQKANIKLVSTLCSAFLVKTKAIQLIN